MPIKDTIKDWWEENPIAQMRRKRLRRGLQNKSATLLCPNCLGGVLFHDLGLQFCSPTVNLMMFQLDFVKFVLNLDHYLKQKFIFEPMEGYVCPCAKLDDIIVHFTHYKTEQEALNAWSRRVPRMDRNNMFVVCSEKDGMSKDDILLLGTRLKVRGLLVFTENRYPDIPYTLQIQNAPVGSILDRMSWITRERKFTQLFDFVRWFNEANGGDYDISPYIK